jgi:hypothetical protein
MIYPRCANCGKGRGKHLGDARLCSVYGPRGIGSLPNSYHPKRPRSSVRTATPTRKAKTTRKILPRCKLCAHPYRKHCEIAEQEQGCADCLACPGYAPARGIRQKRRTPAAAIKRTADELWSKLVKHGKGCEIQQYHPHECKGPLEAMHGIPRTFAATRWNLLDGFAGCSAAHLYFTRRPELWSAILLEAWGYETFRELWSIARAMKPVDMAAVVASLRAEAETRGIA